VDNQRLLAFLLIGLGVLAMLNRVSDQAAWLWVGLVAGAFIWAYLQRKTYGLLVTGCILTGVAVGILLEASWNWDGAFLISLGAGFFAIDQVERKENRWPLYVGAVVAALGLIIGLLESGILSSIWFAIALIGSGLFLITQQRNKVNVESTVSTTVTTEEDGDVKTKVTQESSDVTANKAQESSVASDTKPKSKAKKTSKPTDVVDIESPETPKPKTKTSSKTVDIEPSTSTEPEANDVSTLTEKLELWRRETAIGKVKLERYGEAILALLAA